MKKTLLIAAMALGAAGAANAQLSLYGLIDMSYGKSIADDIADLKNDFHSGGDDSSGQGNSTTRFGLKGSTDVGSGIKANFKLESGGITSNGDVNPGGNFFNRQAWLGFSGAFGEVRLGRQDSVPFQTMIGYDFNGASNGISALGYSGVAPWGAALGRQSRSLQYITPTFAGLSGQVGFQPKGNGPTGTKDVLSGGITYAGGPISVSGTFQSKANTGGKTFSAVAGSYDLGVAKFSVGYANGGKIADGGSGKGISLGAQASLAGFTFGALLGKNSDDDIKATAYEIFVNKEVLKNTYAYAEVGKAEYKAVTPKVSGTGLAVGVIYVF